jgi:integrase
MGKKGNGEGSIYEHKRNGKKVGYRGAYWVHTAEGPKRRYVSGKTRDETHEKLIEALGNRAQGLVFDAGSLTVGEYLMRWLEDSVRDTVRTSTYEVHRHMIQPHIVPALGRLKLKDLNPVHVRSFYREKLDSGLSAATVRKMHSVLRKALKQAVLDGLVPRNVCEAVKPPKVERKEITPLDRDQAKALLELLAKRVTGSRPSIC